jgi:hypothetical protein
MHGVATPGGKTGRRVDEEISARANSRSAQPDGSIGRFVNPFEYLPQ